ncbi:putative transcriptional regulator [Puniceicoccus vermicola]
METTQTSDSLLDRALRVLDLVALRARPVGFNELLETSEINRSTLAKILRILCAHGMLQKTEAGYRIGNKPSEYAQAGRAGMDFLGRYRPHLRTLADQFGVTALLLRGNEEDSVCLEKVVSEYAPAMRPLGSVVAESPIHPWTVVRLQKSADLAEEKGLVSSLLRAAKKWPDTAESFSEEVASDMVCLHGVGISDDFGSFFPHVRRIAVRTTVSPPEGGIGVLVTGFFPKAPMDVRSLMDAMRRAAE